MVESNHLPLFLLNLKKVVVFVVSLVVVESNHLLEEDSEKLVYDYHVVSLVVVESNHLLGAALRK